MADYDGWTTFREIILGTAFAKHPIQRKQDCPQSISLSLIEGLKKMATQRSILLRLFERGALEERNSVNRLI